MIECDWLGEEGCEELGWKKHVSWQHGGAVTSSIMCTPPLPYETSIGSSPPANLCGGITR